MPLATCALVATSLPARAFADDPGTPAEVIVRSPRPGDETTAAGRATSSVGRRDMDERLPRSAPDALRYEPGVFVQQTAHGQASPFLRGRTGQQTVLLFDGIRLNTSTYRQGPNQYFFTVDTGSVQSIEVVRGGASTPYGSDAIGGAIDSRPVEPRLDPTARGATLRPRAFVRYASADSAFGQRLQLDTQISERLQVLVGIGYHRSGHLRSGGPVHSPVTGETALVPVFEADGKTQKGTGYGELTADARAVYWLSPTRRVIAATYVFREYDAPRTDQCPAPKAPLGECLTIDEQFRTLSYVSYDGDLPGMALRARVTLSYQRQHEKRTLVRPAPAFVEYGGRDDVDTFGLTSKLVTAWQDLGADVRVRAHYGADAYLDRISSSAYIAFTNLDVLLKQSRGQYLSGSGYLQGGLFALTELSLGAPVTVRAGGRAGLARARSPSDPESGTLPVSRTWPLLAGMAGVEWQITPWLAMFGNLDRSVRAPNLDDLTSRQQTGPGFQFENPSLGPEIGTTADLGLRLGTGPLTFEAWGYRAWLEHAMTRGLRSQADCPPETPQCGTSKRRVQLVNVAGVSRIDGVELWGRAHVSRLATVTATVSYAYGEGPSPSAPDNPDAPREPLSRIPPLNGTIDARVGRPDGVFGGAGFRWAREQTRLSTTDYGDARIPRFGTPGFGVLDLRLGYRMRRELVTALVLENVTDAAYRYHGSSINGPGRGILLSLESGL
jgi:outer membrane receptor protein involved in Fe transport